MNLQQKKILNLKVGLSVPKKQMMGVYILSPKRPLILDSASGNLYMNSKLNLNLPDLIGLLASDKKKLNYPMHIEARTPCQVWLS